MHTTHRLNRRALLGRGASGLLLAPAAARAAAPLRVCLISGSKEYGSAESLAALQEHLEKQHGARCARAFGEDRGTGIPGLEGLEEADTALVFARRVTLPEAQLALVKRFCQSGRGIVGIRTASHAFQNWLEFDPLVLGGNYQGHYGAGPVSRIRLEPAAKEHPVTAGVRPFDSPYSLYRNTGRKPDGTLLMTGSIPGHEEPVTWTRMHGRARVFYTSLGGPDDFRNAEFRRMVLNALAWSAGRPPLA